MLIISSRGIKVDELIYMEIKNWIMSHARPLEQKRFLYLFESGSKEEATNELIKYQNLDGGFGHGLEPDSINPNSSPIQTWAAFEIIDELKLDKNDLLVRKIINYFMNKKDFENGFWFTTIPSNNEYPRASWWNYANDRKIWGYNPTAAIHGFIYHYALLEEEKAFVAPLIKRAIHAFLDETHNEMHELRAFIQLYEYIKEDYIDSTLLQDFKVKLQNLIYSTVEKDSSKWFTSYCARPSQLVQNNKTAGYDIIKNLFIKEKSMLIENRDTDGVWKVTWNWGQFEDAFLKSKIAWKGIIAIGNLKIIKKI